MASHKGRVTQEDIKKVVGVSQSWVSQYKSGDVDADIDQLAALASVFGHTLNELIDLRPDPAERDLIDAYRSVVAEDRHFVVELAQKLSKAPPSPPAKKR